MIWLGRNDESVSKGDWQVVTSVADSLLDVELYEVREAARLLRISPRKLRRWLNGATVDHRYYAPVIRQEPSKSDSVTWGEFVEAGYLREYRHQVSLQKLRPLIDQLREDTGKKYPLAEFHPQVDTVAKEAVLKAQDITKLDDDDLLLVRRVGHRNHVGGWQTQWAEPMRQFLEKIEFDASGLASRMFPLGKERRVTIDPNVVFGIPQIKGVRTEIIAETYAELGDEREVAEDWDIDPDDVRAALQWEMTLAKAA
jgi:uncharacterized protein (DUF433 family)